MIDLEITFENSSWEQYLSESGTVASAAQLLQLLEGENENTVEDAMGQLEARGIDLDIRALPKTFGSGEEAVRLRQETEIAKSELKKTIRFGCIWTRLQGFRNVGMKRLWRQRQPEGTALPWKHWRIWGLAL